MKIVFYSSSSNVFSGTDTVISISPRRSDCFESLAREYPEHSFSVVTQMPGSFLLDISEGSISSKAEQVSYRLTDAVSAVDFADEILKEKPDIAIAATFWAPPYDWMGLKDSLIADELRKHGVDAVCPSSSCELTCFDKKNTADFLASHGFPCPRSIYVHHEYFWAERGNRDLITNNYKDFVLSHVAAMKYPVVIKDCVGLSSYGMEVAVSYPQAVHYLKNGRNVSDRMVEEYLDGLHFGTEIYGRNGKYRVFPPMLFSLNRYGITSPKLSVKMGPITSPEFKVNELIEMLERLACEMDLDGFAQVDLIFSGGKWYIIEINPRLSGMTETYAASIGKSSLQMMVETALGTALTFQEMKKTCNFKLPLLSSDRLQKISSYPHILYLHQHENLAAKQEREKGYCEAVVGGFDSFQDLMDSIREIRNDFPEIFDGPVWEHILWAKETIEPEK